MLEIVIEEVGSILKEWWEGVCLVLGFSVVFNVMLAIGGVMPTFESIGKTVVMVMVGVGVLALGFLIERIYRRVRSER